MSALSLGYPKRYRVANDGRPGQLSWCLDETEFQPVFRCAEKGRGIVREPFSNVIG